MFFLFLIKTIAFSNVFTRPKILPQKSRIKIIIEDYLQFRLKLIDVPNPIKPYCSIVHIVCYEPQNPVHSADISQYHGKLS